MIGKDLETAREDGTIFVVTDEYLANNRPLWHSVISRPMLNHSHKMNEMRIK